MDQPTVTIRAGNGSAAGSLAGQWGPFQLIQKVGQGSFGEVYRAFDTTLQREVALKLLLPTGLEHDLQAQANQAADLLREARAIARVRHPNVVPVYGVDTHDGRVGFWSDFVHGKTLAAIVRADGPFGARESALIGIDLCKAVGAVHAAGLLHRDIKAGNAMRESGGRILLLDFGLSLEHGVDQGFAGTAVYMAPELLAGQPASIATDIYALGVLLFHLMTGKYPVDGPSLQAIKSVHESDTRQTLLEVRADVPEPLARVVGTATNINPTKRYRSTGQMLSALTEAIGLGPALDTVVPAKGNRYRLWLWALIPVAVAALAFTPVRNAFTEHREGLTPIASVEDDYQKAHDLVEHYYRANALDTAIPLLERAVAGDPHFAPAYADLGRANLLKFIQLRDPKFIEPSRQASLHALNLKPDLASAHVTLGILYRWTGKNDLASQELDDALKLDRFNAAAYAARGNLFLSEGRNAEAEPMFQKAVSLAPDDWFTLLQLGSYYDEAGKYPQAAQQYQHAADLAPDNPRAQNNLAYVSRLQGHFPEAEAAYQKAIALEPTAGHYRNLGQVLLEQGKYPEAREALERAVELKADDYRSWGFLATVYASTGATHARVEETFGKAITLAEALRKQARNDYVLADLGGYYAALGMAAKSEPLLEQAATLQPDSPELLYEVAKGYEMLHKRDQAIVWIGKATAAGLSPQFLARIPQLASLRADARYQSAIQTPAHPAI